MFILGIETSCDETAVAIVQNGRTVLSNIIASSAQDHAKFGGVFPEIAARKQLECMIPAISRALNLAKITEKDIDAIAVTKGPGLLNSLLVGVTAARVLASVWKKPLIGVHHTMGHLASPWLEHGDDVGVENQSSGDSRISAAHSDEILFPLLTLSVSGGHTDIWLRTSHTQGTRLGSTQDDAAGEAFDKGATMLGLPYPGGPALAKLSEGGNPHFIQFPRPLLGEKTCSFSFSGLKTSLKYAIRDRGGLEVFSDAEKKDTAASFQEAICLHLFSRIEYALSIHPEISEVHIVGGVSANKRLRLMISEQLPHVILRMPSQIAYCTDNAAMIASAGYFLHKEYGEKVFEPFSVHASLTL